MTSLEAKLLHACDIGKPLEVQKLLEQGADLHFTDRNGSTALNEACVQGHAPVVGLLLRSGADPNVGDNELTTPLHRCCFHGWHVCVPLLLDAGADPYQLNDRRKSALDVTKNEFIKKKILDFPAEKTKQLLEEWKEKNKVRDAERAERQKIKDEEEKRLQAEAAQRQEKREAKQEDERVKAAAAAEAKRKRDEEQRELARLEESNLKSVSGRPDIYVTGCVDKEVNGRYVEVIRHEHRVELHKNGDKTCTIIWASYTKEWRLACGNLKGGNTLFRNPESRLVNDVPLEGWMKWFGNGSTPTFTTERPENWVDDTDIVPLVPEEVPISSPKNTENKGLLSPKSPTKTREFLEPTSSLRIVPEADEPCMIPEAVKVLDSNEEEKSWIVDSMPPVDPTVECITEAKNIGNEYFAKGDLIRCIDRFTRSITAAEELEEQDENTKYLLGILHSNRSLAFMKLESPPYPLIVQDCNAALEADPGNFKALYRRANALSVVGDYEPAFKDINKVLEHYLRNNLGSNPAAVKLRDEIKENLEQERIKWHGTSRQRQWNVVASQAEETPNIIPTLRQKAKPKTKWTRADVEKHLESGRTGADFWDNFCTIDVFKTTYQKIGISVDAFAHLLQVLPQAEFDETLKNEFLQAALKTISPTVLDMLSSKEKDLLQKLDKGAFHSMVEVR